MFRGRCNQYPQLANDVSVGEGGAPKGAFLLSRNLENAYDHRSPDFLRAIALNPACCAVCDLSHAIRHGTSCI